MASSQLPVTSTLPHQHQQKLQQVPPQPAQTPRAQHRRQSQPGSIVTYAAAATPAPAQEKPSATEPTPQVWFSYRSCSEPGSGISASMALPSPYYCAILGPELVTCGDKSFPRA